MQKSLDDAYEVLLNSIMYYNGKPVGTIAADDPNAPAKNYEECFVRDFVPSAYVFLCKHDFEIVANFLLAVLDLSNQQQEQEGHRQLSGVMPASFKVVKDEKGNETLVADFGDHAIGRVAPVDSLMWWILLLDAYISASGDHVFLTQPKVQWGVISIVTMLLQDRYESFPTLIVSDGSFMIDRRLGVYGHPLEIQALFFAALRVGQKLLKPAEAHSQLIKTAASRERELKDYIHEYYWMDFDVLNGMHRFRTEEFGLDKTNVFNIYPESIPPWLIDWIPENTGYLVGNLGPGRMDFRFFSFGNLLAIIYGLTNADESKGILSLFERRWNDLIGMMPVKI